ncbi:MAG TPA: type II and III secretion system protein family protein [Anaeromyxobacteraceae bacterium]|nr:type II and III secretion system protein family protein [Anaeromyxobacteraceae bacterium]
MSAPHTLALLASLALGAAPPEVPAPAAPVASALRVDRELGAVREMALEAGQNRLLILSEQIVRVAVADPEVADLKVVTPTQVLLTAKGFGTTDLTLWNRDNAPLVIALQVARSVEPLRRQLRELFPAAHVSVSAAGELVVLSGEVADLRLPERIAQVARLHAKQVANLISVSGDHQVQLEVRFAEVTRSGIKAIGVNLFGTNKSGSRVGGQVGPRNTLGGFLDTTQYWVPSTGAPPGQSPYFPTQPLGETFQLFFGAGSPFPFNVTLSLLEENGLAKVLAEPTLVALTGQEAKFLAGGEIPIPISSSLGQVSVEWKKFGIQLAFTPTVLDAGTVSLKLATEVSDIDPANGIQTGSGSGLVIPGLSTRKAETTVRVGDGQSFAIAGLLSDKVRSTVDKVPLLGSIPVLGALFRSSRYVRQESELLVVITTRIVRPLAPHQAPALPTDYERAEPGSAAFFLLGKEGGSAERDPKDRPRGPTGPGGFAP